MIIKRIKKTATKSGLAKVVVSCSADILVGNQSLVNIPVIQP
jgi:hypothetical protein